MPVTRFFYSLKTLRQLRQVSYKRYHCLEFGQSSSLFAEITLVNKINLSCLCLKSAKKLSRDIHQLKKLIVRKLRGCFRWITSDSKTCCSIMGMYCDTCHLALSITILALLTPPSFFVTALSWLCFDV